MSRILCPECTNFVGETTRACPHCGFIFAPDIMAAQKETKQIKWGFTIDCPKCAKSVSETTHACPHCGFIFTPEIVATQKEKRNNKENFALFGMATALFLMLIIFSSVLSWSPSSSSSSPPSSSSFWDSPSSPTVQSDIPPGFVWTGDKEADQRRLDFLRTLRSGQVRSYEDLERAVRQHSTPEEIQQMDKTLRQQQSRFDRAIPDPDNPGCWIWPKD